MPRGYGDIHSFQDVVYSIGFDNQGRVLLGAGNKGNLYRVESPTRYTLLRTVPAFCAPPIGNSSDRRVATLPKGARAANLAVT